MSVGGRIAEHRKAMGWTQSQLAEVAQVSASAIAMYETNRRLPDTNVIQKLASALDTDVQVLMGVSESANPNPTATPSPNPKQTATPSPNPTPAPVAAAQERVRSVAPAHAPMSQPTPSTPPSGGLNLTTFSLTREEARIILFLRMNPQHKPFLESYVVAEESKRQQLERTWRIIHEFQK